MKLGPRRLFQQLRSHFARKKYFIMDQLLQSVIELNGNFVWLDKTLRHWVDPTNTMAGGDVYRFSMGSTSEETF